MQGKMLIDKSTFFAWKDRTIQIGEINVCQNKEIQTRQEEGTKEVQHTVRTYVRTFVPTLNLKNSRIKKFQLQRRKGGKKEK